MTLTNGAQAKPAETAETADTDLIPIIDLDPLSAGKLDAATTVAPELRAALEDVGFFFVVNHGVSWELVEQIYAEARRLHAAPSRPRSTATIQLETSRSPTATTSDGSSTGTTGRSPDKPQAR